MTPAVLITIVLIVQTALGIAPKADRLTWAMENAPTWIGLVILAFTYKRFPLSRFCLTLLAMHSVILAVGGHYTYAKVPLGEWMKEWFGFSRNHYDRIGHFVQGFIPAVFVRELLLRTSPLPRGKWLAFLVVSVCLAFSACYEFIELWAALVTSDRATDFLGTQGDPWDTQTDMFMALLGATCTMLFLTRWHDDSLDKVQ